MTNIRKGVLKCRIDHLNKLSVIYTYRWTICHICMQSFIKMGDSYTSKFENCIGYPIYHFPRLTDKMAWKVSEYYSVRLRNSTMKLQKLQKHWCNMKFRWNCCLDGRNPPKWLYANLGINFGIEMAGLLIHGWHIADNALLNPSINYMTGGYWPSMLTVSNENNKFYKGVF